MIWLRRTQRSFVDFLISLPCIMLSMPKQGLSLTMVHTMAHSPSIEKLNTPAKHFSIVWWKILPSWLHPLKRRRNITPSKKVLVRGQSSAAIFVRWICCKEPHICPTSVIRCCFWKMTISWATISAMSLTAIWNRFCRSRVRTQSKALSLDGSMIVVD